MSELDLTNISALPDGKEFIDMALSRFLPTGSLRFHELTKITTFRDVFIRRVGFSAAVFEEKLTVIDQFPDPAAIRPLHDRICHIFNLQNYLLSRYQIDMATETFRQLRKCCASSMTKSDSVHKLKCLSVYYLGTMCMVISLITPCLVFLEEIRPHLVAFPAVDPNVKRIKVVGYPRGGIDAHILRWLDRLEEVEGLSQADGDSETSGRDLNPDQEMALIWARISQRKAEGEPNVTPSETLEEAEGLRQADGGYPDLSPSEEAKLMWARFIKSMAESQRNVTSNATPSEM